MDSAGRTKDAITLGEAAGRVARRLEEKRKGSSRMDVYLLFDLAGWLPARPPDTEHTKRLVRGFCRALAVASGASETNDGQ